ncbi:MAG: 3-ketoacyl-ACP reductase [Roseburia sp.]|nr:3-ketoacyl-ACP reductase [Roseburia sp.]
MKKYAVVTGACGGIGYATVQRLIRDGYQVLATSARPVEKAVDMFDEYGNAVTYLSANIGTTTERRTIIAQAQQLPRVDVLVNVAGVAPKVRNDLLEMTEESYDYVMDINTKGTLFLTQAVAKIMLAQEPDEKGQRGYIINISSLSAYTSSVSRGEYCISKAGVSMITQLFADRLAAHQITVNEIRPGIIATGMTAPVKAKYDHLIESGLLPNPRWGEPEDVAEAVAMFYSGSLRYTTGQSVDVDGGFHISRL